MPDTIPTREAAFNEAMESFLEIDKRFGSDNPKYPSIDQMMGGYRGFSERVIGEALVCVDATICPLIEAAADGTDISIDGAVLSNVRHTTKEDGTIEHVVTALGPDGTPAFRLEFNPRPGHGTPGVVINDISFRECRAGDPYYPYTNSIGSGHVDRNDGDKGARGYGYGQYSDFAKFVAAMDVIKPFVAANLEKVNRGKPHPDIGLSSSELNLVGYRSAIDLDGGLPGELCLEVSDAMATSGAKRAFRFLAKRLPGTISGLATNGATFGLNYLSFGDGDYMACAVPGSDDVPAAILTTQANLIFDHNSYLAWNEPGADGKPAKTFLVALERGRNTLAAVEAFMAGERPVAPTGVYTHADASVSLPREFLETSMLSIGPFSVDYTLQSLKEKDGEVREHKEMVETHTFDEDVAQPKWDPSGPLL
ncbi:hypothetical protein [Rhizobium sp. BK176]|uniref:hypothetical protein n=1 Tax=Rhizobium sp. BK176 TaxID=2587071 RepID=UPI00216815A2|nr:hypothetical protein [Rhizobium sp. BK176]MCS4088959.1 hypothetical protein [Rhizobium sp. BK176]